MGSCHMVGTGWKGRGVGGKGLGKPLVWETLALIFLAQQVTGSLREQTFLKWPQGRAMALLGLFVMNPPMSPHSRHCFNPCFTEEETKVQGGEVTVVHTVGALGDMSSWV